MIVSALPYSCPYVLTYDFFVDAPHFRGDFRRPSHTMLGMSHSLQHVLADDVA